MPKSKVRKSKKKEKRVRWCMAITDGGNCFGPGSIELMPVDEAIAKGYDKYIEGKDPVEMWIKMMIATGNEDALLLPENKEAMKKYKKMFKK